MPVMALVHVKCQPEDMACLWRKVVAPVWSMCCRFCANHYNQIVKIPSACVTKGLPTYLLLTKALQLAVMLKLWLISKENVIPFFSSEMLVAYSDLFYHWKKKSLNKFLFLLGWNLLGSDCVIVFYFLVTDVFKGPVCRMWEDLLVEMGYNIQTWVFLLFFFDIITWNWETVIFTWP